ncbi:hypothetical protein OSTOST_22952, partial [Ostertagia ostertagi]
MVRNGPGMFKIGDTEYKHWFDGMAYIQRYHFEDGKVDIRKEAKISLHTYTAHFHNDHDGNLYNIGTIMGHCYVFTKTMNPLHAEG